MRKFKKLLTMLLSATMVCSLSAAPISAGAADESKGSYGDVNAELEEDEAGLTTLSFQKFFEVGEGVSVPGVTFDFTMTPDTTVEDGATENKLKLYPGVDLGDGGSASITFTASDTSTKYATADIPGLKKGSEITVVYGVLKSATFNLSDADFTDADAGGHGIGVYRYEVKEKVDTNNQTAGTITYDSKGSRYVDLYVDGDGKVCFIQAYIKNGTELSKCPIVFDNKCNTTNLQIKKTVTGNMIDNDKEFSFYVKIPTGGTHITLEENQDMKAYIQRGDTKIYLDGTTTDDEGNTRPQVLVHGNMVTGDTEDSDDDYCEVKLKNGDILVIPGITAGMVFYAKEAEYSDYTTTYSFNDATPQEGNDPNQMFTTGNGNNLLSFVNYKESTDTGIVLDVMPYVVIVLVAAAGVLLFVFRKRRIAR
jgi:hypothetical protein